MEKVEEVRKPASPVPAGKLPVSVIIAARNEAKNLPRCLQALREVGEVYVIDSQSTDDTVEIARSHGAQVVQFHYQGGWPKKRQWAMNTLPIAYDWVLLLDADEVLTPELAHEIRLAIQNPAIDGYSILLRTWFLGRPLRHGDVGLWKLSLFRRGKGRYECRLKDQNASMADMEVHEHVVVKGATATLRNPLIHHNVESLSRYIQKHDEYSNWESRVLLEGDDKELPPSLFRHPSPAPALAEAQTLCRSGFSRAAFPVSLCLAARVPGRRAGPYLLRVSGGSDVSHQGQDLRTEAQEN